MKATCQVLLGLALASVLGCYAYYPYGYGYPGAYGGAPGTTMPQPMQVPQGAYLTPQDFSPGTAQPLSPPTSTFGNPNEQWKQHNQSPDRQVEAFRPDASQPATESLVPEPRDAGQSPFSSGVQLGPQDQFGPTSSPLRVNDGPRIELEGIDDLNASTPQDRSNLEPVALEAGGLPDLGPNDDPFMVPVPVKNISAMRPAPATDANASSETPNPFDHDRRNYRWLRGIVDFDETEGAWHIMYSEMPESSDQYGGDLTLADHPDLAKLTDGDIVMIEGRPDSSAKDQLDKPHYRITKLVGPLVPVRQ